MRGGMHIAALLALATSAGVAPGELVEPAQPGYDPKADIGERHHGRTHAAPERTPLTDEDRRKLAAAEAKRARRAAHPEGRRV